MTRKNRREIENAVEELDTGTDESGIHVVYKHPKTGAYYDMDGDEIDPPDDSLLIVLSHTVVMDREKAEAEGKEIIGPAEDTNDYGDYVRAISSDYSPF